MIDLESRLPCRPIRSQSQSHDYRPPSRPPPMAHLPEIIVHCNIHNVTGLRNINMCVTV